MPVFSVLGRQRGQNPRDSMNNISSIIGEFWSNERPVSNEVSGVLEDDCIGGPPPYACV